MLMICSLIEHGFLPVFSIEGKGMLYSNLSESTPESNIISRSEVKDIPNCFLEVRVLATIEL